MPLFEPLKQSKVGFDIVGFRRCLQKLTSRYLGGFFSMVNRFSDYINLFMHTPQLSGYGIDDLDVILAALNRGWSNEAPEELEDYDFDETVLNEARLNILARQNRVNEYLNLCLETGEYLRYILKQIEVGEFTEAIEMAWKTLTQAGDALIVARTLRDAGRLPDALRLAEKGLSLGGSKHDLVTWLGPIEETQGRIEQAIQAFRAAFTSMPSLELYTTLQRLSDADGSPRGQFSCKYFLIQVAQTCWSMSIFLKKHGTWRLVSPMRLAIGIIL